jgi:hypothetical protein
MTDVVALSALDHVVADKLAGPIQLVFEFPAQLDARRLVDAYHETAQRYVGVASTLMRIDEHTLGLRLSPDASVIRVTDDGPEAPLHACVDPAGTGFGEPLARARIVNRGSRGTAIGFSLAHAVADGYGFFLFLAAWAARTRGVDLPRPNCDRTLLTRPEARGQGTAPSAGGPLPMSGFTVVEREEPPLRFAIETRLLPPTDPSRQKQGAPGYFSSNDLLAASLWMEAMEGVSFATTTFASPVDVRRHRPELGPFYFGNAFLHASIARRTADVRSASVAEVAGWIRAAVAEVPARLDGALAELERLWSSQGLAILPRVYGYPPDTGFLVSNMTRVPIQALDFGAGPPVRLEHLPAPAYARMAFVLPDVDDVRVLLARHPAP